MFGIIIELQKLSWQDHSKALMPADQLRKAFKRQVEYFKSNAQPKEFNAYGGPARAVLHNLKICLKKASIPIHQEWNTAIPELKRRIK